MMTNAAFSEQNHPEDWAGQRSCGRKTAGDPVITDLFCEADARWGQMSMAQAIPVQPFPKFCVPNVAGLWMRRDFFFQVIYLVSEQILLGRWRLWFICSWHPLILGTRLMTPCKPRSSQRRWGVIPWPQPLLEDALCSPPMPVGLQHPADSMWMLGLWKWGSPSASLPFVSPPALASDLPSILFFCVSVLPLSWPVSAFLSSPSFKLANSFSSPSTQPDFQQKRCECWRVSLPFVPMCWVP